MLSFVKEHFAPKKAEKTAVFGPPDPVSGQPVYRYALGRTWDWSLPRLHVVMVNPSVADAENDDPTIQRLTGFARRWGYGGLGVINLFALISPDPKALDTHEDPVGSGNRAMVEHVLHVAAKERRPVLAAWGNNGARQRADQHFIAKARAAGVEMICLGLTQHGHPKHPLARGEHRVPDDAEPVPFNPPELGAVTIGAMTIPLLTDGRPACVRCDGAGRLSAEDQCRRCLGTGAQPSPFGEPS